MDAVDYLKTLRRMCNNECHKCEVEAKRSVFEYCTSWQKNHPEEAVALVEKWASEHPIKTRQSVFLEQYPEASISKDGTIAICPLAISTAYRGKDGVCVIRTDTCADCRRKFWLAEVEE